MRKFKARWWLEINVSISGEAEQMFSDWRDAQEAQGKVDVMIRSPMNLGLRLRPMLPMWLDLS